MSLEAERAAIARDIRNVRARRLQELLAEIDRLQATADRRGELLRRALVGLRTHGGTRSRPCHLCDVHAAIVAELAGEGDERA